MPESFNHRLLITLCGVNFHNFSSCFKQEFCQQISTKVILQFKKISSKQQMFCCSVNQLLNHFPRTDWAHKLFFFFLAIWRSLRLLSFEEWCNYFKLKTFHLLRSERFFKALCCSQERNCLQYGSSKIAMKMKSGAPLEGRERRSKASSNWTWSSI